MANKQPAMTTPQIRRMNTNPSITVDASKHFSGLSGKACLTLELYRMRVAATQSSQAWCSARVRQSRLNVAARFAADA
jgi:hypothetical protein